MSLHKHAPTRTLRDKPDLVQLKRQAKELLQAYVAGDSDAMAEVDAHYREQTPRASRCTTLSSCSRVPTASTAGRN